MKTNIRRSMILVFLLSVACTGEKTSTEKYFNFDGLIDDQISQLSQSGRVLDKVANMGGEPSDSTYLPSEKGWASELEIFRELEIINKPTYRNVYKIEDPVEDVKSNLKIRQYSAAGVPVPLVKFYYQDEIGRLKKIEAVMTEGNLLFSNRRVLVMELDDDDGKPILVRYTMNGFQKMMLSDTVRYSVTGEINR